MSRDHVFLGPSLPLDEAHRLHPRAIFHPPAAVGDVYALARRRPMRIAIVDGYFERMAAVWHKELLWALERRTVVWGAASMGALRAAELAPFGMRGIGSIYRAYARGALVADDEVAVRHLPEEYGFRATSEAMVNVRATLAAARRRGVISARVHDALVERARGLFYPDRVWDVILARQSAATRARIVRLRVDAKARDARALLRRLAASPARRPPRPAWRMSRTWFWDRFVELCDEP